MSKTAPDSAKKRKSLADTLTKTGQDAAIELTEAELGRVSGGLKPELKIHVGV